jgi:hypothetical protein
MCTKSVNLSLYSLRLHLCYYYFLSIIMVRVWLSSEYVVSFYRDEMWFGMTVTLTVIREFETTVWLVSSFYKPTYIHACVHIYIPWIHRYVTKTVGCGTCHKYTNIHNFYSVKYYKHLTKQYYRSSLLIKIHLQSNRGVYLSVFLRL